MRERKTFAGTRGRQSLGAAFQKVNFLRDMKADQKDYPGCIFRVVISKF